MCVIGAEGADAEADADVASLVRAAGVFCSRNGLPSDRGDAWKVGFWYRL